MTQLLHNLEIQAVLTSFSSWQNSGQSLPKGILGEDGIASSGSMCDDIKQLFALAKDLGSDSNESFFSKVSEVTEGRRNGKFMDSLLSNLSATGRLKGGMNTEDILAKMINIMGSRVTLQDGFREGQARNLVGITIGAYKMA